MADAPDGLPDGISKYAIKSPSDPTETPAPPDALPSTPAKPTKSKLTDLAEAVDKVEEVSFVEDGNAEVNPIPTVTPLKLQSRGTTASGYKYVLCRLYDAIVNLTCMRIRLLLADRVSSLLQRHRKIP